MDVGTDRYPYTLRSEALIRSRYIPATVDKMAIVDKSRQKRGASRSSLKAIKRVWLIRFQLLFDSMTSWIRIKYFFYLKWSTRLSNLLKQWNIVAFPFMSLSVSCVHLGDTPVAKVCLNAWKLNELDIAKTMLTV